MSYKICPVCKEKNSADAMICQKCLSDISSIEAVDEEIENICLLKNSETTLKIKSGDIVGREGVGREYLSNFLTVSRKHCQFFYEDGEWFVMDLNSTNKTYLNKKALLPNTKTKINNNDELSLSKSLTFTVEI